MLAGRRGGRVTSLLSLMSILFMVHESERQQQAIELGRFKQICVLRPFYYFSQYFQSFMFRFL